jgi:hypothetical protein
LTPIRALARGVTLAVLLAAVACSLVVDLAPYSAGCGAGTKRCSVNGADTCVSTTDPFYGCARPGNCVPCLVPNATAICDKAGACAYSVCNSGFFDCNNLPADGCEVSGNTDYNHCGISAVACNTTCADTFNNVAALNVVSLKCASGQCAVDQCKPGFKDCDTAVTNGCEIAITPDKCGLCIGCPGTTKCDTTATPPKCVSSLPMPDAGGDANAADAAGDAADDAAGDAAGGG